MFASSFALADAASSYSSSWWWLLSPLLFRLFLRVFFFLLSFGIGIGGVNKLLPKGFFA